jgi:polyisoprenyl-phosphate glycosyltransferase
MREAHSLTSSDTPAEAEAGVRRSLIVPIYRSEANITDLIAAIRSLSAEIGPTLEVIFVIDGSPDRSADLLAAAVGSLPCPSRIVFHSRNFGAFTAIRTGLEIATGPYFAVMAADLQEPADLVVEFFRILSRDEADVVFGQRTGRKDPAMQMAASNLFWWAYRKLVLRDMPPGGVDIFACNRRVRDVLLAIEEPNSSLVSQLFWVGFRRAFVPYMRRPRQYGTSAWNLSRRLRYMMDSVFSFSDAPILIVLWFGIIGCILSVLVGVVTVTARIAGLIVVPGYTSLLLIALFYGSAILAVQGVIGCYLWRTFENTKKRPLRVIANITTSDGAPG